MLGNLKDLLGGDLGDAGDLIGTLGKVVTKAKPVKESEATAAPAKEKDGGLLGNILDAVTDGPHRNSRHRPRWQRQRKTRYGSPHQHRSHRPRYGCRRTQPR